MLERYPEALDWYRSVPGGEARWTARLREANVLHELKRADEAYEALRGLQGDATVDEGTRRDAYLLEAELRGKDRQVAEELDVYARGLAAYPDDPAILYSRALTWERRDDIPRAEADFRRILVAEPDNVTALNALGYTLADRTTRFPEALELIDRARAAEPDSAAIIDSYGWVLYRLGRKEEALVELRRALRCRRIRRSPRTWPKCCGCSEQGRSAQVFRPGAQDRSGQPLAQARAGEDRRMSRMRVRRSRCRHALSALPRRGAVPRAPACAIAQARRRDAHQAHAQDRQPRRCRVTGRCRGRIAVSNGKQGGSGRIDWQQSGALRRLAERAGHAPELAPERRRAGRGWRASKAVRARAPMSKPLLREATRWDIPVRALSDWLRGVGADAADTARHSVTAPTTAPARLDQAGWTIDYARLAATAEPRQRSVLAGPR